VLEQRTPRDRMGQSRPVRVINFITPARSKSALCRQLKRSARSSAASSMGLGLGRLRGTWRHVILDGVVMWIGVEKAGLPAELKRQRRRQPASVCLERTCGARSLSGGNEDVPWPRSCASGRGGATKVAGADWRVIVAEAIRHSAKMTGKPTPRLRRMAWSRWLAGRYHRR